MKPLKSVSGVLSTKDRTVTTKSLKRLCPSGQGRFFRAIFAQLTERSPDPVVAGQNKKQPRGGAALKRLIKQIGMRTGTEQEKLESVTIHAINKQPVGPDVAFSEADVVTG